LTLLTFCYGSCDPVENTNQSTLSIFATKLMTLSIFGTALVALSIFGTNLVTLRQFWTALVTNWDSPSESDDYLKYT